VQLVRAEPRPATTTPAEAAPARGLIIDLRPGADSRSSRL
jgi:hypothetical protein